MSNQKTYRGFSLIEVVVALGLTTIVLGAVFGLLLRGSRTVPRETEIANLQAEARNALEGISRDILEAGANLPGEFPSLTPWGSSFDRIEIVGSPERSDPSARDAMPIVGFQDNTVIVNSVSPPFRPGDLVLVYDDLPTDGKWMFGIVASVAPNRIVLKTQAGDSEGDITLPADISMYNRPTPTSGVITPVRVIAYFEQDGLPVSGVPGTQIMRQVNWGTPVAVAFLESLQLRYVIGGTTSPSPPMEPTADDTPPVYDTNGNEIRMRPPHPQPSPDRPMQSVVRGVEISVTGRSLATNLEGSTRRSDDAADAEGFIRRTFTSRVTTRNLVYNLGRRGFVGESN